MPYLRFVCIFLCVCVLQFTHCVVPGQPPTSGPFKASIAGLLQDCSNPAKPYVKNSPVVVQATIHNNTMSGNITILRDTKNVKIRVRGFAQRNGKWEPVYLFNIQDCHGMMLHLACVSMNIKYDRKRCVFSKGSYSFKNLDSNQLVHLLFSKSQYGHILWRTEAYSQAGTFLCNEYETVIEPA